MRERVPEAGAVPCLPSAESRPTLASPRAPGHEKFLQGWLSPNLSLAQALLRL